MQWLQTLDAWLLHCINPALSNPIFDKLMPFLSGNPFFGPVIFLTAFLLVWKGGARGRIFLLMIALVVGLGDSLVINTLKHLLGRPRPFFTLPDIILPPGIGRSDSGSMPSSHAANWFAGTMVAFIYYRRSIWFMLPMAIAVSFSRLYNGVHYPSDILVGAILGAGYGACGVWSFDALWQWAGRRWFPVWWQSMPSLLNPIVIPRKTPADPESLDQQFLRLGYAIIALQFLVNLAYIASDKIMLSEDEAYQWTWSKHLALSYYSKPLFIALAQFIGTHLWGDTAFGVRFLSPVIGTITAIAIFRFMVRNANVRVAFWLAAILPVVPLLSLGSTLMTIDPLSVLFWTFAMIAGWRAVQEDGKTGDWFWAGLWMGCGLLSKYVEPFQLLSFAVFFALWPPARKHLSRPGPYLALLVNLACTLPIIIWNKEHHWITFQHVNESVNHTELSGHFFYDLWHCFTKYTVEFVPEEIALQNPFFFLPILWAMVFFWNRSNNSALHRYLFCMGAPLLLTCFLWTFHARVLPNWIAPSIVPLFCLGAIYWEERWREGYRPIKYWLTAGMIAGLAMVIALRDTSLITRFTGIPISPEVDSTRRVKGWTETAQAVEAARQKLLEEGKPVFIIGGHYGITGELSFYLPEARGGLPDHPLVYYKDAKRPENEFYFWPSYKDQNRLGQNAIFVQELDLVVTNNPALSPFMKRVMDVFAHANESKVPPVPPSIEQEFESVTNNHAIIVTHDGVPVRRLQIAECRGLR